MTEPLLIKDLNLSETWAKALGTILNRSGKEITPLVISLTDFSETQKIRDSLDTSLKLQKLPTITTVSETIFPNSLYKFCNEDRHLLYNEYLNNLNRIKKLDKSNKKGTYFERLISYDGNEGELNQLEIIIKSIESNKIKRRSKLQASIFNPTKDHTNGPFQGFPCLQHITFYKSGSNGLIINSFYAIQYLYRRGYGNWLGLINLGKFIAHELDMELVRFNCYIGVEQLDQLSKTEAKILYESFDIQEKS